MSSRLKKLAAISKWVFWAVIAFTVVVLTLVIKGLLTSAPIDRPDGKLLPDPPEPIRKAKEKAEEQALVVRAEVKVKTEEQQADLSEITEIDDGVERRKRLAAFLRTL